VRLNVPHCDGISLCFFESKALENITPSATPAPVLVGEVSAQRLVGKAHVTIVARKTSPVRPPYVLAQAQ
jgi:hypothetical protein